MSFDGNEESCRGAAMMFVENLDRFGKSKDRPSTRLVTTPAHEGRFGDLSKNHDGLLGLTTIEVVLAA